MSTPRLRTLRAADVNVSELHALRTLTAELGEGSELGAALAFMIGELDAGRDVHLFFGDLPDGLDGPGIVSAPRPG